MGNKLAFSNPSVDTECDGLGDYVSFFHTLNVKWLGLIVNRLKESKQSEFSLQRTGERLKWNEYFRVFTDIKEKMVADKQEQLRSVWHPAAMSYSMGLVDSSDEQEVEVEVKRSRLPSDDHTDDDPSVVSDEEDDDNNEGSSSGDENDANKAKTTKIQARRGVTQVEEQMKPKVKWDSSLISPIFFGHNTVKAVVMETKAAEDKANLKLRENRAIGKAKETRSAIIDALEKSMKAQESNRLKKMEALETKYVENREKSQAEFDKNKKEMPAMGFETYQRNYILGMEAAQQAHSSELAAMRLIHDQKTAADIALLRAKREDLEAFKDAENQELPAAERLEAFARVEVSRWVEELGKLTVEMDKMRVEYIEIKLEYDKAVTASEQAAQNNNSRGSASLNKQVAELKSMVNVAETSMREAKRHVEEGLQSLEDAEILLDRAVRMRNQQDELLPLFKAIAHMQDHDDVALPSHCNLNIFIVSAILLMSATYDQKYHFLIRLFDSTFMGSFKLPFISSILSLVQQALYVLKYVPYIVPQDDMESTIVRSFLSLALNPKTDYLTEFEVKQCILTLVSHSSVLTKVLGISMKTSLQPPSITFDNYTNSYMSTYQRNKMSSLTLLTKSMIDLNTAKYQLHYHCTQYRPLLSSANKQAIHERAFAMGSDDPLRADYTKFLVKPQKKEKYRVDPLTHGHLANMHYVEQCRRDAAALKIQTIFRSFQDKKIAELAAKYLAFVEAKQSAIKEMKLKIIREFKKRESGKGMGKMKWDAQVRMKQAKLRTTGQSVNRGETVMVMIEESIHTAKEDIEARFLELEKREKFTGLNFNKVRDTYEPSQDTLLDVQALFDIVPRVSLVGNSLLGKKESLLSPRPVNNQAEDAKKNGTDEAKTLLLETPVVVEAPPSHQEQQLVVASLRTREYIEGYHAHSVLHSSGLSGEEEAGETEAEWELAMSMAAAEPTKTQHLFKRLRAMQFSLTTFKVNELLAEMPTKRLLLLFVQTHNDDKLAEQLARQFKFKKNFPEIIKYLRNMVRSDMENGILKGHLLSRIQVAESGLYQLFVLKMSTYLQNLQAAIDLKLETSEKQSEREIISEELSRMQTHFEKHKQQCEELVAAMQGSKEKLAKTLLSYREVEGKLRCIQRLKDTKEAQPVDDDIPLSLRYDWLGRMTSALKIIETTAQETAEKYAEISNVSKEFLDVATKDARIIVNEINAPKYLKTIPIAQEFTVAGRPKESGRGLEQGKYYSYEAHNILYRVALDYDGAFNGSDEFAAKSAGLERLGAQEYFRLSVNKIHVPIVATLDIQGYRVLAMSKLPTQNVMFNEDGEVRKVSEDLVHGVHSNGELFINKSRMLQNLLRLAANRLNLCEHLCKGSNDISSTTTSCSSEMKVFKSTDDQFFVRDFWRSFPSEIPEATPHLPMAPREQSIFWRQLRPEFVLSHPTPLSPDAGCGITIGTNDGLKYYNAAKDAAKSLVLTTIPAFVEDLLNRDYALPLGEGLGLDLTSEMHVRGINMRHLGLMRSKLWRQVPGTVSLFHHESRLHTSKDLRRELMNGDKLRVLGVLYTIVETPKAKITAQNIPIDIKYMGDSVHGLAMSSGCTVVERNCEVISTLLLGEMAARTIKHIVRLQMRQYNRKYCTTSAQFFSSLVVEYLNVVSGSSPGADLFFQNALFEGMRVRFGESAVRSSEKYTLQRRLQPIITYIVGRLLSMLGVKLLLTCQSEFHERPVGFAFILHDVAETTPVLKHNIPVLSYADALCVGLQAMEMEKETYTHEVLADRPSVFYAMSERKGGRSAVNKGALGTDFNAVVNRGCDLEHGGPVPTDKYIRSYSFRPLAKSFMDTKFHKDIVSEQISNHFSLEAHFRVVGGKDTVRVILNSGRFNLYASRDNHLCFTFIDGHHEINSHLVPLVYNTWQHVVVTYDGTTTRCYIDSVLVAHMEIEEMLQYKRNSLTAKTAQQKQSIAAEEQKEKELVVDKSRQDGLSYFQTKEGVAYVKNASKEIMESPEFQDEHIGEDARDQGTALKMKRTEAIKRAKERYIQEAYDANIREIVEKFRQLVYDLDDRLRREEREGKLRSFDPLRIGAAVPNASTRDGSNYFYGEISCVSVYPSSLSSDRVKTHFLSATSDRRKDAQRLHCIAASKYEVALKQASAQDASPLNGYAKSLCSYLRMESSVDDFQLGKAVGKARIMGIIEEFKGKRLAEGIAEIIKEIPRDVAFADLVCAAFLSIRFIDKNFFSRSLSLSRKEMIYLPFEYGLTDPNNPADFFDAAAFIFQQVVRDHELMYIYGELDLRWLPEVQNAKLVIALVKQAHEDKHLRMVQAAEIFHAAGHEEVTVTDDDVGVLSQNLSISEGFDLSHCSLLTDSAMSHMDRMNNIRILNVNYCVLITDKGLKNITSLCAQLEVLSLEGLTRISDDGMLIVANKCSNLAVLNVNKCPQISADSLIPLVKSNRKLSTFHCADTLMDDAGLSEFASVCNAKNITSLDISFCHNVTDNSVIIIAESCVSLRFVNLSGLSRVSDLGIGKVCSNCWSLQSLNLEDLFLLSDSAFWFSPTLDGRKAARESMLTSLVTLNLSDCVHLTDHGVQGLAERCRKIERLVLRGCDRLTDKALKHMSDSGMCTESEVAMCDSVKTLSLAFTAKFSASAVLGLLAQSACLEELDLTGHGAIVTDKFAFELTQACKTIQKVALVKCALLSDLALCSFADYLWLEHIDVSYCHRITDDGIDVLTEACTGLISVVGRNLPKITNKSVHSVVRNCPSITTIDFRECDQINNECAHDAKTTRVNFKLLI